MNREKVDIASEAAEEAGHHGGRRHEGLSLKVKGVLAFIVFVLYALLVGIFTDAERQKLLLMVEDLERVHRSEELLVQINMSMARTLLSVNVAFSATDPLAAAPGAVIEIEATRSLLRSLEDKHPRVLILSHELQALTNDMVQMPGRGVLAITRTTLHELITELDQITQATRDRKSRLLSEYRVTYDRVTLQGLAFAVLGIIVLGAATAIFFSRLTWDIRKLEARSLDIVNGYRGEELDVTRRDEVGSLMRAVNQMQRDLRERERHIERARQEQFHREKMVAVGSLASQLAHEINNPIAAISGIASAIRSMRDSTCCAQPGLTCQPDLILEQTKRISQITRQIADFTRPQPLSPELLDLNQLIRSTIGFVSFDRRFRGIDLKSDLDGEMPAVRAVADHITQVLMNLLINAADAMEDNQGAGEIRVLSRARGDDVVIEVIDNGKGMDAETLARAFDEYFTTKAAGKGSGLGLALSRELIRDGGGTLVLESKAGAGTCARITLPILSPERARA